MSASREKKMRQNNGTQKSVVTPASKKTLKKILVVVLVVAILAATVFFGMLNNGTLNSKLTAATVDGYKLSPAMINYFYADAKNTLIDELGSLYDTLVDPDESFAEQAFMNEQFETWGDYLLNDALTTAKEYCTVYNHAMANGFTLSEEDLAGIETEMENAELIAIYYGYPNANGFLAGSFGPGCNTENYREYMMLRVTGDQYMAQKIDSLTYTQEEIDAHYAENAQTYDSVTYQLFNINVSMMEEAEDPMKACEDAAKEMAESITGIEQFNELCKQYIDEEDYEIYEKGAITMLKEKTYDTISSASYVDWVFDAERQPGDVTYIPFETESEQGYHVIHFIEKTDLNYNVVNFHQILIETVGTDETVLAEGQQKAQEIYDAYMNGEEQTEEAFLALVNENSSTSTYTGSYNNTGHGALDNDYEGWLFDESRKAGDVEIVQSEQGYHVMYFAGYGDTFYNYSISEDLKEAAFNEWMDSIVSPANTTTNNFAMKLVKVY